MLCLVHFSTFKVYLCMACVNRVVNAFIVKFIDIHTKYLSLIFLETKFISLNFKGYLNIF